MVFHEGGHGLVLPSMGIHSPCISSGGVSQVVSVHVRTEEYTF